MTPATQILLGFLMGAAAAAAPMAARLRVLRRDHHARTADLTRETASVIERERALSAEFATCERQRVEAETELRAVREASEQKLDVLERAQKQIDERLKATMSDVVAESTRRLGEISHELSQRERVEADASRERDRATLEQLVGPIGDRMSRVETLMGSLERDRAESRAALGAQIKELALSSEGVRAEAAALAKALRRPETRGRWGEMHLRNVVEAAGMLKHVDFIEQPTIQGPDGALRPDMIVRLPGGRRIVVDSKVPLDAFLDAAEAEDEATRAEHLKRHARQLATHVEKLGSKAYWESLAGSPDLVIAFIPNDQVCFAAVDTDRTIVPRAAKNGVVIGSPLTLIALLKLAARGWQQEEISNNTEAVLRFAGDLLQRLRVFSEHLRKHGRQLETARASWNTLVGSFESRLMPAAERLSDLGASSGEGSAGSEFPAPAKISKTVRLLPANEEDEADTG